MLEWLSVVLMVEGEWCTWPWEVVRLELRGMVEEEKEGGRGKQLRFQMVVVVV